MTREESDKLYKELRETMTDEEIAESMIWSIDRTPEEEKKLSAELLEFRKKIWKEKGILYRIKWYFRARYLGYKYRLQDYLQKIKR